VEHYRQLWTKRFKIILCNIIGTCIRLSKIAVMRSSLSLLSSLLLPVLIFSQSRSLPLNFNSYAIKLCVAKDESIALTTKAGEVGLTNSIKSDWRRAEPKNEKEYLMPTLEQANFFNKDTGFVSGFISGKNSKYNVIYHTTDGGVNWKAINFGQDGWVDDATHLDNGEAWLSVAGSGIAYTRDFGFTWKKFKIPEVKQRFTTIYFNTNHEGFIGSLWNLLAYTNDNCETWKLIPTPLDQKVYNKTNKASRPAFNRVAIFNNILLVKQEDLIFYSNKDSIHWVWLKDYQDFFTDADNTALYFQTVKGNFVRAGYDLTPIYSYGNTIGGFDSKCKNGSLFIIMNDNIQQLKPNNEIVSVLITTNEKSKVNPVIFGYTSSGGIGFLNGKAYVQNGYNEEWQYIFDFPFAVKPEALSVTAYDMILFDRGDDSLFYFDMNGKEVIKRSKSKMVEDFCKAGIKEIRFNSGSQGCFHGYSNELVYTNKNGVFVSQGVESTGSKHSTTLADNDEEIEEHIIKDFVKKIPGLFSKENLASIDDLAFTEIEYEQCKKDILDFKKSLVSAKKKETKFYLNKNNIDFTKLISLVDSVKFLDKKRLNEALFNLTEFWSTTNFWNKFELVNSKNEVLSITSSYYTSNAFYFPWAVRLNGYSITTTNIEINKFLNEVYPSFLSDKDRVEILHTLAKKLY